jgi:hypothetical protein
VLRKNLLFIILLLLFANAKSQLESSAYLTLTNLSNQHHDVFSFLSNQAVLAGVKSFSAGFYSEEKFMVKELTIHQLALNFPTHSGNFGLSGCYFGFTDYNESKFGLAYARNLGSQLALGVQFNFQSLKIPGYGNSSAIDFEIGTVIHLTEQLNAGVHLYNPIGGKFGKDRQEKIPPVYSAGLGFEASEKFVATITFDKPGGELLNVTAGFEYKILQQVLLRFGISSASSSCFFGVGYQLKKVILHATSSCDQQLGISPGLSLIYESNKKQE